MLKILRLILFPLLVMGVSIIIFPICIIRPFSYKNTELYHSIMSRIGPFLLGINITIEGKEILDTTKPSITIANHQYDYDLVICSKIINKKTITLGKSEIKFIPFFGQAFWLAGNILINRGNRDKAKKTMTELNTYIKENSLSINIFPEGTRNPTEKLLPFKKGAFYTAIETQVPIVIYALNRYVKNIKFDKWNSVDVKVKVLEPIPTKGLTLEDVDSLMEKVRCALEEAVSSFDLPA
jgi:1-acyl-sn-glycerol-3-phosphate acyltransferase